MTSKTPLSPSLQRAAKAARQEHAAKNPPPLVAPTVTKRVKLTMPSQPPKPKQLASELLPMEVDLEPEVSSMFTSLSLTSERILRAAREQRPSRELPPQESRRVRLQLVEPQSVAPSRGSALTLPKEVQARVTLISLSRVQAILRYVTFLSIDSHLIGCGSAIGASKQAKNARFNQQAHAHNARQASSDVA